MSWMRKQTDKFVRDNGYIDSAEHVIDVIDGEVLQVQVNGRNLPLTQPKRIRGFQLPLRALTSIMCFTETAFLFVGGRKKVLIDIRDVEVIKRESGRVIVVSFSAPQLHVIRFDGSSNVSARIDHFVAAVKGQRERRRSRLR